MSFYKLRVKRGQTDLIPMVTSSSPLQSFSVGDRIDFNFVDEESGGKILEPVQISEIVHLLQVDVENNATAHLVTLIVQ